MKFINLIVCFFLISACSNGQVEQKEVTQKIMRVENHIFDSILKNESDVQLIDVRTANEFNDGNIEGALNWDILNGDFEKNMKALKKESPVALYCHGGNRSSRAREMLQKEGFAYIVELKKGYSNYK